jgi:hypothetical protein
MGKWTRRKHLNANSVVAYLFYRDVWCSDLIGCATFLKCQSVMHEVDGMSEKHPRDAPMRTGCVVHDVIDGTHRTAEILPEATIKHAPATQRPSSESDTPRVANSAGTIPRMIRDAWIGF